MNKATLLLFVATSATLLPAADQTVPGAGNAVAEQIAAKSELVQTAKQTLVNNAQSLSDRSLRLTTLDAIGNKSTCITHRANLTDADKDRIVQNLTTAGLVNPADASGITGGVKAGVFPPVLQDGTNCPQLPLSFNAAPGSSFGGHHSYPGGLPVHEANNDESSMNFADLYRGSYGSTGRNGLPKFDVFAGGSRSLAQSEIAKRTAVFIDSDLMVGAPIWHDWAKTMVFQWNADGSEFTELNFGGNGSTDNNGQAGDSRTGGHHIIGIAEVMKRGLPPAFVITQASAHSAPTSGNEYKVVNWLRAGALLAQIDPLAYGYLRIDGDGNYRLPILRQLGNGVDLNAAGQTNLLVEYALHNLSDADFNLSGPAVSIAQVLAAQVAPSFGYDPADVTTYNTKFRNIVFANLGAERLLMIYGNEGIAGVTKEVQKLRAAGTI